MAGGKPQLTTQTQQQQTTGPNPAAAPYYTDLYAKANEAMQNTNNNPFMGNYVAAPSADTVDSISTMRGVLGNQTFAQGANDFMSMAGKTAAGDYMNPASNPFLGSYVQAAMRPIQENFTNTTIPAITDQSIAQGAYGGARQDLSQERAATNMDRTIGDLTSNIYYQNYQNERNNQLQSANLLGSGMNLLSLPASGLQQIGAQEDKINQDAINNELQKFQGNQTSQWYGLGELAQILNAGGFKTTTGSGTQVADNPAYVDPVTGLLKSLIGVGSMAASAGGSQGFKLWGNS